MSITKRISFDGRVVMRRPTASEDWFVIERYDHDGRVWHEEHQGGIRRMQSANLSPESTIDGSRREMLALAYAIMSGDMATAVFKRCAVACVVDGVFFWSPKNSDTEVLIKRERALDLARDILVEFVA